ncbi:MAG TPA: hypothetical protein VFL66_10770 [Gaiellaceae bacterium]|nr:hypothetical protein [Gaiellaceae bacterium]
MPDRALTWAQTAALNPNTPLCISCGSEISAIPAFAGLARCRDCRRPALVIPLAASASAPRVHPAHLRRAA